MATFLKDPAATLDYRWDFASYLEDGDTISAATVTVPAGLTKTAETNTTTTVTVWLSGGTNGEDYRTTCQITTANGRTDERTIRIHVRDR